MSLTASLVALIVAGWAFGAVLEDVAARNELASWDPLVARFVVTHRESWLTPVMSVVTELGSVTTLMTLILIVGVAWWRWRGSWRALGLLAASAAGATALANGIKVLVGQQRPPAATDIARHVTGYAFPSGHVTAAAAVFGMLAALLASATPIWRRKVAAWATALALAVLVAASRLYLGAHWLTDVLGGLALGAAWVFVVLILTRALDRLR